MIESKIACSCKDSRNKTSMEWIEKTKLFQIQFSLTLWFFLELESHKLKKNWWTNSIRWFDLTLGNVCAALTQFGANEFACTFQNLSIHLIFHNVQCIRIFCALFLHWSFYETELFHTQIHCFWDFFFTMILFH